ncbi:hypothetical protein CDAR_28141 [Caerostris darwini]|uniref:Uncharacterized protein n=1 Tax=Caerostris darwini TaxID=1538125 RepID=A0AAV4VCH3_9ARAC|nr:hypothetical protein CDAR_28141 [Caerostris darwini]
MKNPVEGRIVVQNGGQPSFGDPRRTRVEYRLLNLVDLKEVLLSAPPNLYDNARLPDYWPDEPFLYPQPPLRMRVTSPQTTPSCIPKMEFHFGWRGAKMERRINSINLKIQRKK